jgi:hypothetical protein
MVLKKAWGFKKCLDFVFNGSSLIRVAHARKATKRRAAHRNESENPGALPTQREN